MRTGIPEVEQWSSHERCIRENHVTIYQMEQETEFQMLPSDCKGWDITGIKQYYTYGSTYSRNGSYVPYMQYKMFTFIKLQ